jgi:archaellum component FlaC
MTEPDLCNEKHKRVDERLETHEKRLNNHSDELDRLSTSDTRNSTQIDNLCNKIDGLITTNKWFIGLIVSGYVGFFYAIIQNQLGGK